MGPVKSAEDMLVSISEDLDYEEYAIEEVELEHDDSSKGLWKVTLEYGFQLSWPRGGGYPQPRKGNVVRLYGDMDTSLGLRGVTLPERGVEVYYRTPEDHEEWKAEKISADYEAKKDDFAARRKEFGDRFYVLPPRLQEWFQNERKSAEDVERFDVLETEVLLVLLEHVYMLSLVLEDRAALETFKGFPTFSKMGTIWHAMADQRIEALEKMLARAGLDEDTRLALNGEREDIQRYIERRFNVDLPKSMMNDIFDMVHDMLPDWEDPEG